MIRPVEAHELPALHALVEAAYRGDSARQGWTHEADLLDGQRSDLAGLTDVWRDPAQRILVAVQDGVIVGTITVARQDDGVAMLAMLCVHPDGQAAGLGKRLIAVAEAVARERGAREMRMTVIESRRDLIDWYIRRGYRATGERLPFPLDDPRYGLPRTRDLAFAVMAKALVG